MITSGAWHDIEDLWKLFLLERQSYPDALWEGREGEDILLQVVEGHTDEAATTYRPI
jgi:hypothetical protein